MLLSTVCLVTEQATNIGLMSVNSNFGFPNKALVLKTAFVFHEPSPATAVGKHCCVFASV
jgi:hypothetical protein